MLRYCHQFIPPSFRQNTSFRERHSIEIWYCTLAAQLSLYLATLTNTQPLKYFPLLFSHNTLGCFIGMSRRIFVSSHHCHTPPYYLLFFSPSVRNILSAIVIITTTYHRATKKKENRNTLSSSSSSLLQRGCHTAT
jgi:hypothetical protein